MRRHQGSHPDHPRTIRPTGGDVSIHAKRIAEHASSCSQQDLLQSLQTQHIKALYVYSLVP